MFNKPTKFHTKEQDLFVFRPKFLLKFKSVISKIILLWAILYIFGIVTDYSVRIQEIAMNYTDINIVSRIGWACIILMFLLVLSIIFDILQWNATEYVLTNQRIIIRTGLINRKKSYVYYNKIEDINISQSFIERIFSSGDMVIFTGHDNTEILLEDVPNPENVEQEINNIINESTAKQYHNHYSSPNQDKYEQTLEEHIAKQMNEGEFIVPDHNKLQNNQYTQNQHRQNQKTSKQLKLIDDPEDDTEYDPMDDNLKHDEKRKKIMNRHSDKFKRK